MCVCAWVSEILEAKSSLRSASFCCSPSTPLLNSAAIRLLSLIIPIFLCHCSCIFPSFSSAFPTAFPVARLWSVYILHLNYRRFICFALIFYSLVVIALSALHYIKLILVFSFRLHFNSIWRNGGENAVGLKQTEYCTFLFLISNSI